MVFTRRNPMDYGNLISRAWQHTWQHKWLWILGFLAALAGSGGGGGTGFNMNQSDIEQFLGNEAEMIRRLETFDWGLILAGLAAFLLLLTVMGIVFWLVGLAARSGLITAYNNLEQGQKSDFGTAFRSGWPHVLRLIGMKIALFLPFIIVPLLLVGGLVAFVVSAIVTDGESLAGGPMVLLCLVPLLCLLPFVIIILSFVDAYAFRGIVLQNLGVIDSIRHGWRIFRDNLSHNLILGLIFTVISWIYGLIVGLIVGIFALGATGPLILQIVQGEPLSTGRMVMAGIGAIVAGILAAALTSVLVAWQSGTFTLAYRQFANLETPVLKEKDPLLQGYDPLI
jgi:hypothetical protein